MRRIKLKTAIRWVIAIGVIASVYGIWWWIRTQWIPAGYVGVIYDANSGIQNRVYDPQAVTVGWRQQLLTYPTKLQAAIYTQDPDLGEMKTADGILVTTNDNASTVFDVAVVYHVNKSDVRRIFDAFGALPIDDIQALHIRRAAKEAANAVGTRYDLFELMGPKRQEASQAMTYELRKRLSTKGLTIDHAMLGSCYPSAEIQSKITSRVNSYVELEISKLKQEIAEIERQIAIVRGSAESQAAQLSAAQTQERSIDLLKLEAAKEAIEKWNGQLPQISPRPGQTIVLGNDLLQQLGGRR